jgi:hypothetical protein
MKKVILRTSKWGQEVTILRTYFFGRTFQGMDRGAICWSV